MKTYEKAICVHDFATDITIKRKFLHRGQIVYDLKIFDEGNIEFKFNDNVYSMYNSKPMFAVYNDKTIKDINELTYIEDEMETLQASLKRVNENIDFCN